MEAVKEAKKFDAAEFLKALVEKREAKEEKPLLTPWTLPLKKKRKKS